MTEVTATCAINDFDAIRKAMTDLCEGGGERLQVENVCTKCEGGGWVGVFTPGGGGPNFEKCEACGNPNDEERP